MKQQIIRQFLKEGILISPDALESITEGNADRVLEQAKSAGSLVFSPDEEKSPQEIVVEVRKLQRKQKLTPQDFAAYYNKRLEGMRLILEKKLEAVVSVANAKKSGSSISTIGMVRESTPRGFIIEDTTGWAEVVTKSEDIVPDDVIGVKGAVKEERIFAEELVWPDVSMSHKHPKLDAAILLSEKDGHKAGENMVVITPEAAFGQDKKKSTLQNPGWVTVSKGAHPTTVLVYAPPKSVSAKEAFVWLRKRHLFPSREQIRGTDDPFLIEPIPSLLWIIQPEKFMENYKGVIVVSSDGKVPIEVDMATGETK